ncbi:MAG: XdhC family protein [Blastocatellia bacterium]|nr:XdhC family protein [Blastocatellia bacterium]
MDMGTDALQSLVDRVDRGEAAVLATVVGGALAGRKFVTDGAGRLEGSTGDVALDDAISNAAVEALRARKPARSSTRDRTATSKSTSRPCTKRRSSSSSVARPHRHSAVQGGDVRGLPRDRYRRPRGLRLAKTVSGCGRGDRRRFSNQRSRARVTTSTAIVLITRGHRYDWDCVRAVAGRPAFYVGMIGSRRRVKAAMLGLEQEGVSREALERMYAPIGLDIGAQTPEEIAIAIVAEIILVRSGGGTARPISEIERGK